MRGEFEFRVEARHGDTGPREQYVQRMHLWPDDYESRKKFREYLNYVRRRFDHEAIYAMEKKHGTPLAAVYGYREFRIPPELWWTRDEGDVLEEELYKPTPEEIFEETLAQMAAYAGSDIDPDREWIPKPMPPLGKLKKLD